MVNGKIVGTVEVLSALLGNSLSDSASFKASPKDYIYSHLDYSIGDDIAVGVVENGVDEVHLVLPYYGLVGSGAGCLSDSDLDDISGGDIILGIILAIGAGVGGAAFVGITAGVSVGSSRKK